MNKKKVFIACDTNNHKRLNFIIENTQTKEKSQDKGIER